jgi:hypothetical protein
MLQSSIKWLLLAGSGLSALRFEAGKADFQRARP